MKFLDWTGPSVEPVMESHEIGPSERDRRLDPRFDCVGLKLIIRQRRALGIIHLRDISEWGASGITDMPLAVGSLAFLELKKGHFYAAHVKWVQVLTIGMQFARPMRPATMEKLLARLRKKH